MTLRMLDSITPANLPPGADAYLGYVDGTWPDFQAEVQRFPGAHVLGLAVTAADDAEGLDVENRDATPDEAPSWARRQLGKGVRRPVIYASAAAIPQVIAALDVRGLARPNVRLLSAHYTHVAHICGPASCAYPGVPACDGTQWTDRAAGLKGSLIDESELLDDFFGAAVKPIPVPATRQEDNMATGHITGTKGDIVFPPGFRPARVRFFCSSPAKIAADCRDGKPAVALSLGSVTESVAVPDGVDAITVHMAVPAADGTPVSWAY